MKTSPIGIKLIQRFEGMRFNAYLCPAGVWTIGYGHTKGVKAGQYISYTEAGDFLKQDVARFEEAIGLMVTVPLNQNQFDALVSFVFNIGGSAFLDSTLLRLLNKKDYAGAADQLLRWNKGANNEELPGLVKRREWERSLFLGKLDPKTLEEPKYD
jgi:lysozyme